MSPEQRYSYTEPALCHYNHDATKAWFVYFDFVDHLTGKTKRIQKRGGINYCPDDEDRYKAGNAFKKLWKQKLEKGWNPFLKSDVRKMPMHYTLAEALDEIVKIHAATLSKKTKETYERIIKYFKEWLAKEGMVNIMINQLEKADANRYIDTLISEKHLAARTRNDHLIILATLFNAMVGREWIAKNPFKKIEMKNVQVGRNVAFTDSEKEALKKLLKKKDPYLYYFTQIMYFTFIRRTELARLRVGDFDLIGNTITIPASISKNGMQESVVIPVGLEPILKEMRLEHYPSGFYVFGRHLFPSDMVYTNVNHITSRHNKFLKQLQFHSSKTLYSWKHTGVCKAYYATGKDIYSIMRQCRHKSIETTQVYLKSLGLIQNDVFRNAMVA